MSANPFVLTITEYKRDINVLKHYVQDTATYLSKMSSRPYNECLDFVRSQLKPTGQFPFQDPTVFYLGREENGDRKKKTTTLSAYIGEAIKEGDLIAPTLTTYLPPSVKKSLLVDFIDANVKARGAAKKAQFAAKSAGDKATETIKKIEQTNKKLNNNSISGAHVSASTPLFNRTAHSTLTSNCRVTSGYGNANNEKFLCGNRHYWSPEIVRNNIVSIVAHSDYPAMQAVMQEFGIRHPTVEETMECISYSTGLYWHASYDMDRIRLLVETLTDIERSAFVYTGDLYHLMRFNDTVVRKFITKLSMRVDEQHSNPEDALNKTPEDHRHLAAQICASDIRKVMTKESAGISDTKGTPTYGICASTAINVTQTLNEYRNLISVFWVTSNLPASVAVFPDSIRRSAITGDTDSTIFTVQDWVIWHEGKLTFDPTGCAVAATMIFLASQTITHVLARMSVNFGIEEKRLHQVAMKNEYYFPVFTPTQVAKHYYALTGVQEGNIFQVYDKEIKGVHLKSSNAPKIVMAAAKNMMESIMMKVIDGKKISINEILKEIADIERQVMSSIKRGSHEYFRKGQIKTSDSYKDGDQASPYQQYTLWKEVFAPKYGEIQNPPYMSIKISTELNTPSKTNEWIASISDRALAERLENWLERNNRKHFGSTFMLPEQCIISVGIPEEIMAIVGIRKIVLDTTKVFYLILETLGIYMLNKKTTRLCVDHH
jgi:hypothetical protein